MIIPILCILACTKRLHFWLSCLVLNSLFLDWRLSFVAVPIGTSEDMCPLPACVHNIRMLSCFIFVDEPLNLVALFWPYFQLDGWGSLGFFDEQFLTTKNLNSPKIISHIVDLEE